MSVLAVTGECLIELYSGVRGAIACRLFMSDVAPGRHSFSAELYVARASSEPDSPKSGACGPPILACCVRVFCDLRPCYFSEDATESILLQNIDYFRCIPS